MIAYNAEEHGKELRYQLQVLRDDSSYDFGVYSHDKILGYIEEQNFTVAENMLN